jgi:hypothetical protein
MAAKLAKAHENENAFICFLLFFGIRNFQRVTGDSMDFFPRGRALSPAFPRRRSTRVLIAPNIAMISDFGKQIHQ